MSKHSIEKKAPESWRTPESIPPVPKFRTIVADPPWQKNQSAGGNYGGAIKYYPDVPGTGQRHAGSKPSG